jgi:carbon monoxide dehydrogenase subunit G
MEMTGERRIPAPRETVWRALNDPEVLKASIPGCEHIEKLSDTELAARVALRIGPMNARFAGKVELSDLDPPNGYRISGEGQGGVAGFAKGGATVRLAEDGPGATLMTYDVKAQVGGKMAQLGARLIDSTARSMADQFFDRFVARVAADVGAPAPAPVAAPAAGPSLRALLRFPPPAEIAGLPTVFWGGLAVWIVIVLLMVL